MARSNRTTPTTTPAPAPTTTPAPTTSLAPPTKNSKGGTVTIAAKTGGYRRAGMAHSVEQTEHPVGTFTAKQLEALEADPNLVVVRH